MNTNIDQTKINRLLRVFLSLDEDYQNQLLAEAFKLQLMQSQKNLIEKEGKQFKSSEALQKEIESRSNKRFTEISDMMDKLQSSDDTSKAAIFMFINQLAGKGNMIQEPEITITVNQKEISMKDYLENHLNNADYDNAKSISNDFMKQMEESKSQGE